MTTALLLNHDNIVNLIEICRQYSRHSKTTFYLVFDFAEHDLAEAPAVEVLRVAEEAEEIEAGGGEVDGGDHVFGVDDQKAEDSQCQVMCAPVVSTKTE